MIFTAMLPGADPLFERIFGAAKLLQKHGVEFNILTVVTGNTAAHITEIYEFYRRNGLGYQQYIACLDPLEEPHGQNPYALSPKQYGEFLITLFYLWYKDWKRGRQPYIRQFENYIGILMGYRRRPATSAVSATYKMPWKQTAVCIPATSMYWMSINWEILIQISWMRLTGSGRKSVLLNAPKS